MCCSSAGGSFPRPTSRVCRSTASGGSFRRAHRSTRSPSTYARRSESESKMDSEENVGARQPAEQPSGTARQNELAKDFKTSQRSTKMAGLFGPKKDTRPIDDGLASLVGSDENTAIEFWKKRLEMTAAVPNDIARVGALTPQLRELTRIDDVEERKPLTRARIL